MIVVFIPLWLMSPMPPTEDVRSPALFLFPTVCLSPLWGSLLESWSVVL